MEENKILDLGAVKNVCEDHSLETSPSSNQKNVIESLKFDAPNPLSKSQMKKQARRQQYLETRMEKRKHERQRKKERNQRYRENNIPIPSRKHFNKMADSSCKQRVCVDMSFDDYMSEGSIKATMAQLAYCYAYNRRASNPLQFHIVGLKGKCESEYLDFTYQGAWDVHMSTKPLTEVFAPEDMIYLTSDSPNDLKDIEEDKVYVIGGLLDHNSCPKLTLNLAEKAGIKHARLPIGEYMKLRTRTTLTINQVYEIILKYSESKSWEKAFFDVIPARKGIEKIGEDGTVAECEDEEMVGPSIDEIYGQNEEGGNVISTKSSPEKNEEESTN